MNLQKTKVLFCKCKNHAKVLWAGGIPTHVLTHVDCTCGLQLWAHVEKEVQS